MSPAKKRPDCCFPFWEVETPEGLSSKTRGSIVEVEAKKKSGAPCRTDTTTATTTTAAAHHHHSLGAGATATKEGTTTEVTTTEADTTRRECKTPTLTAIRGTRDTTRGTTTSSTTIMATTIAAFAITAAMACPSAGSTTTTQILTTGTMVTHFPLVVTLRETGTTMTQLRRYVTTVTTELTTQGAGVTAVDLTMETTTGPESATRDTSSGLSRRSLIPRGASSRPRHARAPVPKRSTRATSSRLAAPRRAATIARSSATWASSPTKLGHQTRTH